MSGNGILEIPCLGKPFKPGMLYDCRNERLISDATPWNAGVLKNALSSGPLLQSQNKIFTGCRLDDKLEIIGAEGNFKLSLLSGLADASNYTTFVADTMPSKQQARVTMKYESISSFEELDVNLLRNVPHRDNEVHTNATHFVSAIQHGFNTIFVFDREVERGEQPADVARRMELLVSFLPRISVNDMGQTEIPKMDIEDAKKMTCTLFSDNTSSKSKLSFQEAVKWYQELSKKKNMMSPVPLKVWLHPLGSVDIPGARFAYECSLDTVSQVQSVMENMLDTSIRLNDLLKSNVSASFPSIKKKVSRFKQMTSLYKTNIQETLSSLLSKVRSGDAVKTDLNATLQEIATTPFYHSRLSSWIEELEKEVKMLSIYMEYFKGLQFISSPEELHTVINSLEYDTVVSFVFMVDNDQDKQLHDMYTYLHTGGAWERDLPDQEHWYNRKDLTGSMKNLARNFMDLAKASNDEEKVKYIVTNIYNDRKSDQVAEIQFFQDGQLTDFQSSKIPATPFSTSQLQSYRSLKSSPSTKLDNLSSTHEKTLTVSAPQSSTKELAPSSTDDQSLTVSKTNVRRMISEIERQLPKESIPPRSERQRVYSATCATKVISNRETQISKKKIEVENEKGAQHEQTSILHSTKTPVASPRRLAEKAINEELKIEDNKDGTPSIYKLEMKKDLVNRTKQIAKQSFGEPGQFQEKVLLVVGATGAGKSTLINGMVNYIMQVKWEDDFRFKVVIDDAKVSTSKSQTKYITAYTFYPMDGSALPYKFTIIDTPGFGDTEGFKRDKFITKQIKEFFSIPPPNGIEHLDGIGFVTQASLARLTPTQEYIFASVLSIFGKDLSQNIFMMVTFADGQKPPVLKAIMDANITKNDTFFKFNNSALFADNKEKEDEEGFDSMFWKMGFRSFKAFFAAFLEAKSVKLDLTKEVLKERDHLQTLIEGLNPQITIGLNKIEEMRQEENVLKQRETEIETNKKFTYTVEISKPHQVDISGQGIFTTTCLKCSYTCHNDCVYANDDDKIQCSAMDSDGNCNVCTKHCPWHEHKNLPFLWVYEPVVETRTSEDLKRRYESAKKGKFKVKGMIEKLDFYLQNVHTKVLTMIYRAQESLRRLDEIALKPNPLSNVEYLELLIQTEKQQAKPGWMQHIKYLEEAKRHAEMLAKVTEVNTANQIIQEAATSGDKWYSRFKFW